ncbi:zinc finger protein-like [Tropilaelaps mercedesae]|uniref:Zinc finger protein-like n=1 Tax=Tropilaelaps mercedesae TaxID=418985 RepID=A0A1V9Y0R0_9ACAR|nr:zinc finger protein-like [Tropilaelaps mercedesae]
MYLATCTADLKAHVEIHGPAPGSADESSQDESIPPEPAKPQRSVKDWSSVSGHRSPPTTKRPPPKPNSTSHSGGPRPATNALKFNPDSISSSQNIPAKHSQPKRASLIAAGARASSGAPSSSRASRTSANVSATATLSHPASSAAPERRSLNSIPPQLDPEITRASIFGSSSGAGNVRRSATLTSPGGDTEPICSSTAFVTSQSQLPKSSPFPSATPSREPFGDDEDSEEWMVRWSKPAPASVKKARLLFNRYRNMRSPIKTRRSTQPSKAPVYQRLVLNLPAGEDGPEGPKGFDPMEDPMESLAANAHPISLASTSAGKAAASPHVSASTTTATVEPASSSTPTAASYRIATAGGLPASDGAEVTSPKLVIRTTFGNNTVASATSVSTPAEPDSASAPKVRFKIRPHRGTESVDEPTENAGAGSHKKTKSETGEQVVKMHLYHCTLCKKFFSQSDSLKEHLRLHHKKRKSSGAGAGRTINLDTSTDEDDDEDEDDAPTIRSSKAPSATPASVTPADSAAPTGLAFPTAASFRPRRSTRPRTKISFSTSDDEDDQSLASAAGDFACDKCCFRTARRSEMLSHEIEHERPYQCEVCGVRLKKRTFLTQHLTIHTGERNFKCEMCGLAFRTSSNLKGHMEVHSEVKKYKCDRCDASFAQDRYLKKHMKIHSSSKPYPCEVCDYRGRTSYDLKEHLWVHSPIKPYKCFEPGCEASFSRKNYLENHIVRNH